MDTLVEDRQVDSAMTLLQDVQNELPDDPLVSKRLQEKLSKTILPAALPGLRGVNMP